MGPAGGGQDQSDDGWIMDNTGTRQASKGRAKAGQGG